MATSKKGTKGSKAKARGGYAASMSGSTIAIMTGKALSDEMVSAEKKLRAALRKPSTVAQLRKATGVGTHSVRALLARVKAKAGEERGTYRL